ncbi:hypothetical protein REPUB_Repub17cG0062900 [Reevesia pubescens]
MAAPKSPSTLSETYANSHSFLLFVLTLFFIFLLLLNPTTNPIKSSSKVTSPIPFKRLLLDTTSSNSTSSTMNLHPNQTRKAHTSYPSSSSSPKSSRKQFGAGAHEVPSGPNPISNR